MIEINNMKSSKPLRWRLTAMPLTKEYGATLQIRAELEKEADMLSIIASNLRGIAKELDKK